MFVEAVYVLMGSWGLCHVHGGGSRIPGLSEGDMYSLEKICGVWPTVVGKLCAMGVRYETISHNVYGSL